MYVNSLWYAPSFSELQDTREERERTETGADHVHMQPNPVYGIHTTNMCTTASSEDYEVVH